MNPEIKNEIPKISRRDFLRGAVAAAVTFLCVGIKSESGSAKEKTREGRIIILGKVVDEEGRGIGGHCEIPPVCQQVPPEVGSGCWNLAEGEIRPDGGNAKVEIVREVEKEGKKKEQILGWDITGMDREPGGFLIQLPVAFSSNREAVINRFFSPGNGRVYLRVSRYGIPTVEVPLGKENIKVFNPEKQDSNDIIGIASLGEIKVKEEKAIVPTCPKFP